MSDPLDQWSFGVVGWRSDEHDATGRVQLSARHQVDRRRIGVLVVRTVAAHRRSSMADQRRHIVDGRLSADRSRRNATRLSG